MHRQLLFKDSTKIGWGSPLMATLRLVSPAGTTPARVELLPGPGHGPGGGRATPGIDHGRFAPGSGRPRERDAPSSPGVGHTPGIATTPGSPGWGMTPGTSGHFLLQIGKTEQKQSKNKKKSVFSRPA